MAREVADPGQVEAACQLGSAHAARQLEQGERVAAGLGDDAITDALVQPTGDRPVEQGPRVLLGEPTERHLRKAVQRRCGGGLTGREHDRHRLGEQAPRDEPENLGRDAVQPLHVVDQAQQRPVLGDRCQQAQHGHGDEEAVGRIARGHPQRDPQRGPLRCRERIGPAE
jgi:hypothetical protein